jgi:mannosyltransferase
MKALDSTRVRRLSALALAATILLAAAVRLSGISAEGLTSDEAFSWRIVQYPFQEMLRRAVADVHPPLYYILLKPWLALLGDSPPALRGLSVFLGVLLVPAVFVLTRECARHLASDRPQAGAATAAGLLAALLVALHPTQVLASQNARMYSLSAVLAALATLALLRALRDGRGYWIYGVAMAAAAYAHYYAFFTVAAQVLAALGIAWGRLRARDRAGARAIAVGLSLAGIAALVLYAPWLPALWSQTRQVAANYWIPRVTGTNLAGAFFNWATGLEPGVAQPSNLVVAGILVATAIAALRTRPASRILLVQAGVPWMIAVGLSVLTPRSVFLPRYLAPVQIFLLAFWAAWAFERRARWARTLATVVLIGATVVCAQRAFASRPTEPVAEQNAADFLAARLHPGDVLVTDSPRALNRMRYSLAQRGISSPETRCLLGGSVEGSGHFAHTAALAPGEIIQPAELDRAQWPRLWWGAPTDREPPLAPATWRRVVVHGFEGWVGTRYTLARYVREERVTPPGGQDRAR